VPLHVNFDMQNLPADQCNVALDLERIYRISGQRSALPRRPCWWWITRCRR
jgi:hypothetical protein